MKQVINKSFILTKIRITSKGASKKIETIPQEEFEEFKEIKKSLLFLTLTEEKMALVTENYNELEIELLKIAQKNLTSYSNKHEELMLDRLQLERRFLNLLASSMMYLEHTRNGMIKHFGENHEATEAWNKNRQKLHLESISYRFIYKLRNISLHGKLPIEIISKSRGAASKCRTEEEINESETYFSTIPSISIKTITESDISAADKAILIKSSAGKPIDIRPHTRRFMDTISILHKDFRSLTSDMTSTLDKKHKDTSVKLTDKGRHIAILTKLEGDKETERIEIFDEIINYRKVLNKKYPLKNTYLTSFVTNAIRN